MKPRFILVLLILALFTFSVQAETYHFGTSPKGTNISFSSETILESILGSVNTCSGDASINGDSGSVNISIPVDQMRTGIEVRDHHMLEDMWLDGKNFPTISFVSKHAKKLSDGKWEVTGDFTMHGVSKSKTVVVETNPIPDDKASMFGTGKWMRFKTEFSVKLADYDIKIESVAEGKVNEEWKIKVMLFGGTAEPK